MYLCSHWEGSELPERVKSALAKKERWDDEPYLARIVFDEMTGLHGEATGFGIDTQEMGLEHPLIVIDCQEGEVTIGEKSWSFQEYIEEG